jgi:hypothetical protein
MADLAPFMATIREASAHYGIPQQLLIRQIMAESGGNPAAKSPAGAVGMMQLMPATAKGLGVGNPYDPRENIMGGAHYLADQYQHFGNWRDALAAYNAGPGAVTKYGGVPPYAETQDYVDKILAGGHVPNVGAAPQMSPSAVTASAGKGVSAPTLPQIPRGLQVAENQANQAMKDISLAGTNQGEELNTSDLGAPNWKDYLAQKVQNVPPSQVEGGQRLPQVGFDIPATFKSGHGGGFLPQGATYIAGRHDQGQDFQTNPGGPIIAPGAGVVIAIRSDPGGFGPSYPIVHFTSGPYKGQNIYIGHTIAQLGQGAKFKEGEIISHTGRSPIGNASVPGWAEIGYANHLGVPGKFGQKVPF